MDINLDWASVYWTHEELFGTRMTETELVEILRQIAIDDCLEALARLSCMVEGSGVVDRDRQIQILRRIGFSSETEEQLIARLQSAGQRPSRMLFFPQQVVHLTRLAIQHCDRRPRDRFDSGKLASLFVEAIFGVTDLFREELKNATPEGAMSFVLRQLGLMSRAETLYLFSRYYELLVKLWPTVIESNGVFEPAVAFKKFTGLTIEQYFTMGFGVYTRFLNHVNNQTEPEEFALQPDRYFGDTLLNEADWRRFLSLLSGTPDSLRASLNEEDANYGPTRYRSHSFDRCPLVEINDGLIVPTSFAALERAVTEGVFWLLADAAESQGLRREAFTSPFGKVFERFAQEALERIAAREPEPPKTFRDFSYGSKRERALSSDISIVYPNEAIFVEIVTGRPNVATETRGDIRSFWGDVERLIAKKARQLRRCWNDFFIFGRLKFDGTGPASIRTVWPVLVLIEGFPLMPPLFGEILQKLRGENWPKGAPALTLIDADELGALEELVERGWTTRDVIRHWKRDAPQLPLTNWLAQTPGLSHGRLGHASWYEESFRDLTRLVERSIFGHELSDIEAEDAIRLAEGSARSAQNVMSEGQEPVP
ncbi:MAG TPA: hypothetical protein VG294_04370 [Solirubrobacteraceae bacterium]|jgi:hypothetical protein|nr:hypothetical protein [Solirubrobacteraceae bacterium]